MKPFVRIAIAAIATVGTCGIANARVAVAGARGITPASQAKATKFDALIVLAGGVRGSRPSPLLEDRLITGLELYRAGSAPKVILTGNPRETAVMREWFLAREVPEASLVIDAQGLDTYSSMYRAQTVYGIKNALVVTQRFHLTRALYIADSLGLAATGVEAPSVVYTGELRHSVRELLARPNALFDIARKRVPG